MSSQSPDVVHGHVSPRAYRKRRTGARADYPLFSWKKWQTPQLFLLCISHKYYASSIWLCVRTAALRLISQQNLSSIAQLDFADQRRSYLNLIHPYLYFIGPFLLLDIVSWVRQLWLILDPQVLELFGSRLSQCNNCTTWTRVCSVCWFNRNWIRCTTVTRPWMFHVSALCFPKYHILPR